MAIDFRIRDFLHPVEILRLHREFEENQWLSAQELQERQNRLLQRTVKQAAQNVPYYEGLFQRLNLDPAAIRQAGDLAKLPVLDKGLLRHHRDEFVARNARRFDPRPYYTSGTSGQSLEILHDRGANALEFVYYWRFWSWGGYRLGDPFAQIGTYFFIHRPHLNHLAAVHQPVLRCLNLNANLISPAGVRQMVEMIRRHRPKFLKGIPSSLYFLAATMRDLGIKDLSFESVFTSGEVVTPLHRRTLEEVFHCKVFDSYGHMERTVAISQCPEGSYHVHTDYGLLELLDPEEREGGLEATAIGTSLHNMGMPLIRYRIGDRIELFRKDQVCPCGRQFPVVKRIGGRSEDVIVTPDGRYVTSLFVVPELLSTVRFVQFHQAQSDGLLIRVVPAQNWDESGRDQLLSLTRRVVGDSLSLRVEEVSESELQRDPSGKVRVVIGHPP